MADQRGLLKCHKSASKISNIPKSGTASKSKNNSHSCQKQKSQCNNVADPKVSVHWVQSYLWTQGKTQKRSEIGSVHWVLWWWEWGWLDVAAVEGLLQSGQQNRAKWQCKTSYKLRDRLDPTNGWGQNKGLQGAGAGENNRKTGNLGCQEWELPKSSLYCLLSRRQASQGQGSL